MSRSLRMLLLLGAAGVGVVGPARGQTLEFFIGYTGTPMDSALAIPPGRYGSVVLRLQGYCGQLASFSVTVYYDASRVRLASAGRSLYSPFPSEPTVDTSVAGQVTLSASGGAYYNCWPELATLVFQLDGAAQNGSLLSVRPNQFVEANGNNLLAWPYLRTNLLNLCQAVRVWGDVDSSLAVNSRDALVALTAAVGTSVTGFNLDLADVDLDKQVTSRDALFILSAGIGLLDYYYGVLAGKGIANQCAPLAPAPADMVFWRSSTLYRILAGDTVPSSLGVTGYTNWAPTWSPDGAKIAYAYFVSSYSTDILVVNRDGTGATALNVSAYVDFAPSWSPDGTRIAFVSNRVSPQSLYVMNADGTGQVRLTTAQTVEQIDWSPDGSKIAFTGYQACCATRLWKVSPDGSGLAEVFTSPAYHLPSNPTWGPGSDSLLYYNAYRGFTYQIAASGDTAGVPASRLLGYQEFPYWATAGRVFRSQIRYPYDFFHQTTAGRHLRITRGQFSNDYYPVLRRTGLVYVDTVRIEGGKDTLAPDSTTRFTRVVKNNDGSTNTTAQVTWLSRDTTIATVSVVNDTAIVTARNVGGVYIVATAGGWRSDSARIAVAVVMGAVNLGFATSCSVTDDSRAFCWGQNQAGQFGNGTSGTSPARPMKAASGAWAMLTSGDQHTCGLTTGGIAYCWGRNTEGQVGDGTNTASTVPVAVSGGLTFSMIDAGFNFVCGVTTGGQTYCWGQNQAGQLGDSTYTFANGNVPTLVRGGHTFTTVQASSSHSCGVTAAGAAYCWGSNTWGQLGDSTNVAKPYPVPVRGGFTFTALKLGSQTTHTCGIVTGGAVYCWGLNTYGELGDSTNVARAYPVPVRGGLTFSDIDTGTSFTCGVTTSVGAMYCWGSNGNGRLGNGGGADSNMPVLVSGGLTFTAASLGAHFACGKAGAWYCWGTNTSGELGDGTYFNRSTPVRVLGQR